MSLLEKVEGRVPFILEVQGQGGVKISYVYGQGRGGGVEGLEN